MLTIIIAASVGVCVAAIVGAVALMVRGDADSIAEDRLSTLTNGGRGGKSESSIETSLLRSSAVTETTSMIEQWMTNTFDIKRAIDQSDLKITVNQFALVCFGLAGLGFVAVMLTPVPKFLAPCVGIPLFFIPFFGINFARKRRIAKFNAQLPEALEMLSRSLRAGHSLGAGFGLIAEEMPDPLAREFGRCFEEQNLGLSLEQTLESLTVRIPNLDLRFFATAVILQRQTGGDLAEILDKIGRLIRARYRLHGQIQALTGEGRLSGIVLLALPPGLFGMMFYLNRDYVMKLFTDPMGQWMLGGAIVMQLLGAYVIKKIIDIKV